MDLCVRDPSCTILKKYIYIKTLTKYSKRKLTWLKRKETKYSYNTIGFNLAITTQEWQCGILVIYWWKHQLNLSNDHKEGEKKVGIIKKEL